MDTAIKSSILRNIVGLVIYRDHLKSDAERHAQASSLQDCVFLMVLSHAASRTL